MKKGDEMRIFMTGASGFIGQVIVRHLLNERHSVVALMLPQEPERLAGGASIVRGDVTRAETLSGAMKNVDAVIHAAGSVGFQTWQNCIAINRDGTRNVVREAVHSGVRRFIHLSSVSVYGRTPDMPIREDSPLKKIGDPYGDTKIDAECILQEHARQGNLDLTIIRPTVVYGPGDNKFLPTLLANLQGGAFRIIGNGNQAVDLVHVDDLAALVLRVLNEPRTAGKAYNVTNPGNPSWNDMIRMVSSELGMPMPQRHLSFRTAYRLAGIMEWFSRLSRKAPRLNRYTIRVVGRSYHYLTDAAQRDLGFAPSIDLLDGLKECMKTIRIGSDGDTLPSV
jgi:nucleoside-diphosphate-sugar epimerase